MPPISLEDCLAIGQILEGRSHWVGPVTSIYSGEEIGVCFQGDSDVIGGRLASITRGLADVAWLS